MTNHESFMHRCLELASIAEGCVAPNPMVGAVLVYEGRIIGEGYHQQFGGPHAEVDCIESVATHEEYLIRKSIMYVSLEPCAHFGKTPPCADRIIKEGIPKVVIGCADPFPSVDGKGIQKLRNAGVEVELGLRERECRELNKRFFTYHLQHRPYVILKWAQTFDGIIGNDDYSRLLISNEFSNKIVHRWRSQEAAILVGTNTAFFDDPALTTRLWRGRNPLRLVLDLDLRLPSTLQLFKGDVPTIVFNSHKNSIENLSSAINFQGQQISFAPNEALSSGKNIHYYQVTKDENLVHQILNALYHLKIQSVIVEGGAKLLQTFIDEECWDEVRIITNEELRANGGIRAPQWPRGRLVKDEKIFSDRIQTFRSSTIAS